MVRKKKSKKSVHFLEKNTCENRLLEMLTNFTAELRCFSSEITSKTEYLRVMAVIQKYLPVIYKAYDDYCGLFLNALDGRVTCSKGCSYCCCHNVTSVEPYEIIFLDWKLKERADYSTHIVKIFQRWRVFEQITVREQNYNEDIVLYKDFLRGVPCPFLSSENECLIHLIRPISCRMFFSLSNPSLCKGENTITPSNKNIAVELSDELEESLAEAANYFQKFDISPYLFKGLMDVNQLFGKY